MLELLGKWEPVWLFGLIAYECFIATATLWILCVEYWYDKQFNENIKASRRERRRKKYEFESLTEGESR